VVDFIAYFFFSSRRRHTRWPRDWSSDVCSSDLLATTSVFTNGHVAMWTILSVGLFNSIMFPCIFTMGIDELGPLTGDGSGILNMAIVGGAVIPWLVGKVGDLLNHRFYAGMIQGETSWGQGIHYALIAAAF